MVIDSSAVLAIAFQEPEAERLVVGIAAARARLMSAVNWLETLMVVEGRYGAESADDVLLIFQSLEVLQIAFDREHSLEAREAWRRFGKGRHPAALNMGDCCAYATAVISGEPLLYKGRDFGRTDVGRVEW